MLPSTGTVHIFACLVRDLVVGNSATLPPSFPASPGPGRLTSTTRLAGQAPRQRKQAAQYPATPTAHPGGHRGRVVGLRLPGCGRRGHTHRCDRKRCGRTPTTLSGPCRGDDNSPFGGRWPATSRSSTASTLSHLLQQAVDSSPARAPASIVAGQTGYGWPWREVVTFVPGCRARRPGPHNQRPARLAGSAERMMAGCRRLRVDYDRDSERFSAFAMLAWTGRRSERRLLPKGRPMDDRGAGRAAVRFGNADQERGKEPGPGIAGAALRAAGGVVGRRSCRRDDVMVELADGTRKLLSELTGAEAAAGSVPPRPPRFYGSESRPAGEPSLGFSKRCGWCCLLIRKEPSQAGRMRLSDGCSPGSRRAPCGCRLPTRPALRSHHRRDRRSRARRRRCGAGRPPRVDRGAGLAPGGPAGAAGIRTNRCCGIWRWWCWPTAATARATWRCCATSRSCSARWPRPRPPGGHRAHRRGRRRAGSAARGPCARPCPCLAAVATPTSRCWWWTRTRPALAHTDAKEGAAGTYKHNPWFAPLLACIWTVGPAPRSRWPACCGRATQHLPGAAADLVELIDLALAWHLRERSHRVHPWHAGRRMCARYGCPARAGLDAGGRARRPGP